MENMSSEVKSVYEAYPKTTKEAFLNIRKLIYETAEQTPSAREIQESLKWGQPTYSTMKPKSGTPIRLDSFQENKIGIFFHFQTKMIENLRLLFPNELEFSYNRAIILNPKKELLVHILKTCIEMALTYHKKHKKAPVHHRGLFHYIDTK